MEVLRVAALSLMTIVIFINNYYLSVSHKIEFVAVQLTKPHNMMISSSCPLTDLRKPLKGYCEEFPEGLCTTSLKL